MLFGQSENGNRTLATGLVCLFLFSLMGVMVPASPLSNSVSVLDEAPVVAPVSIPEQTYELYLDTATSETVSYTHLTLPTNREV